MRYPDAQQARRRADAVELLRDTPLTLAEIGARVGVSAATVAAWNARLGWPRPPRARRGGASSKGDPGRPAPTGLGEDRPHDDPADVAVGQVSDPLLIPLDAASAAEAPILRAHLRAHIARQIAAFDAALKGEGAAVLDSARVLRDLGGLKRLFDEVAAVPDPGAVAAGEGGDGGSEPDLPALRAEIARRYAGFVGGGAAA